jgi:hypothetical protein
MSKFKVGDIVTNAFTKGYKIGKVKSIKHVKMNINETDVEEWDEITIEWTNKRISTIPEFYVDFIDNVVSFYDELLTKMKKGKEKAEKL